MHHQLIKIVILFTMLALTPHTHADDANKLPDLIAKAETGDPAAQLSLAVRYRDGEGVEKDSAAAMRWAHRAADQGHADAMDFVGFCTPISAWSTRRNRRQIGRASCRERV